MASVVVSAAVLGVAAAPTGGVGAGLVAEADGITIIDYVAPAGLRGGAVNVYSFGKPCVADLNADGHADIVWSQHHRAPKNLYLGTESGEFIADERTVWEIHDQHSCAVADFDGDGRLDIFESTGACSGTCLKSDKLFLQAVDGSFADAGTTFLGPQTMDRSREAAVVDVDRDGLPDLFINAAVSAAGSHHRVLRNLGRDQAGTWLGFGEIVAGVERSGGSATCAAAADFDADGWSDLAVCQGSGLFLFRNTGGVFELHAHQLGGTDIRSVQFEDFDGDGLVDVALARNGALEIRGNAGGGDFSAVRFSAPLVSGWDVTAPDIDGDGDRDVFVSQIITKQSPTAAGAHSLWLNPGSADGTWERIPVPQPIQGGGDKVEVFRNFRSSGRDAVLVSNGGGAKLSTQGIATSGNPGPRQVLAVAGLWPGWPPSMPVVDVDDVTLGEGTGSVVSARFTVTLTGPSESPVSVRFRTEAGTATAGLDFTQRPATVLTFQPGETSKQVLVSVRADGYREEAETFRLLLDAPSGAELGKAIGTATVVDDDVPPGLFVADAMIDEGDLATTPAAVTVSLSAPSDVPVTVSVRTVGGTARSGIDFVAVPAQVLTFPAGVTTLSVTVEARGDTRAESTETFFVDLSTPVGAVLADRRGQVRIVDDD